MKTFAAYDPNLVITDAQLTAKNAMTEAQIQEFLVIKGSFLANYTVPAPRTVTYYISQTRTLTTFENSTIGPYGISTEVDVRGWRASRVIWQVSQWYGVNPQVVLSIIEKESSFILGRTSGRADGSIAVPGANSYATYAWLMGYAYTEDTNNPAVNVCGVATPGANPSKSCAGFAAQLDNATWAVANWMNLANAQSSGNNYSCGGGWSGSYRTNYTTRLCDGDWITPQSGATAALYRYTPHTGLTGGYAGARSFYLIYTNWFDPGNFLKNNMSISNYSISNGTPAKGETVTATFSLTNTLSVPIVINAVGFVARPGAVNSTVNRDFGWNANSNFVAGETKTFTFTTVILDTGPLYVWPVLYYQGAYTHYYQGWTIMNIHLPKLTITANLTSTNNPLFVGQDIPITVSVKNNEKTTIKYDSLGIPVRNNTVNKDVTWLASGEFTPGEVKILSGVLRPDKAGVYVAWVGILQSGEFRLLKADDGMQYLVMNIINTYPDFLLSNYSISNASPIVGETVTATFSLKNNLPAPISIDAIGFVARPDSINSIVNRDYGWKPNEVFSPGQTRTFEFTTTIKDKSFLYVWPAFYHQGSFVHYFRGWTVLTIK